MIPKTIHYCWFGAKKKSPLIEKCLRSWRILQPDYTIMEWNEDSFDITVHPFAERAYNEGKWAFVSDFCRLHVLYTHGGIYLDTDIEVVKVFDDLLQYKYFLGFMFDCALDTGVLGSIRNSNFIRDLLHLYDGDIDMNRPNNRLLTEYFLQKDYFALTNSKQITPDGGLILPKEYLSHPSFRRKKNYSLHHFSASWKPERHSLLKISRQILRRLLGEYIYRNVMHRKNLRKNEYYNIYRKHMQCRPAALRKAEHRQ